MTTLNSRFSPWALVSVTCIEESIHPLHHPSRSPPRPRDGTAAVGTSGIRQLVRAEGLEPPRLASPEPKSGASTSFATPAHDAAAPPQGAGVQHAAAPHKRKQGFAARLLFSAGDRRCR